MRAWALLLILVLAGCLSPAQDAQVTDEVEPASQEPTPPDPSEEPPQEPPEPEPEEPPASGTIDGFVRDAEGAVSGATVTAQPGDHATTTDDGGGFSLELPPGTYDLRASDGQRNGTARISIGPDEFRTVFIDLEAPAEVDEPDAPDEPAPEPISGFLCPDGPVQEPFRTHGKGDPDHPTLQWAVLKTGFRVVVALEAEGGATLEWVQGRQSGQAESPGSTHVFVIEGVDEGKTLCFRVDGGQWHAVHTGNAMNALDDVYTANFLILANEETDQDILAKGIERFAELTWDASDGHIRLGAVIVVVDAYEHQDETVQPCWNSNPGLHVGVFSIAFCDRSFDILFTHNVHPAAAGATYKDGIQNPETPIWMNAAHEAGLASILFTEESQVNEVGKVLTHEVGHYMLGAQDLYPSAGIVTEDCYQQSTGISIMGSNRAAHEYDSPNTPCATASSEYQPTWSLMRERFPAIPERDGPPLPGPAGTGGAFQHGRFVVGL